MQHVKILDTSNQVVANAHVSSNAGQWKGSVVLEAMPLPMQRLFSELEEVVEGQMFSFLDDVENRIAALNLRAVLPDGVDAYFSLLHIYPTTGAISFTLAKSPALA